jgi:hypothetical protein
VIKLGGGPINKATKDRYIIGVKNPNEILRYYKIWLATLIYTENNSDFNVCWKVLWSFGRSDYLPIRS